MIVASRYNLEYWECRFSPRKAKIIKNETRLKDLNNKLCQPKGNVIKWRAFN